MPKKLPPELLKRKKSQATLEREASEAAFRQLAREARQERKALREANRRSFITIKDMMDGNFSVYITDAQAKIKTKASWHKEKRRATFWVRESAKDAWRQIFRAWDIDEFDMLDLLYQLGTKPEPFEIVNTTYRPRTKHDQ